MYYTEDEAKKKLCPHGMSVNDKYWASRCRPQECMCWIKLEITSQKKGFCAFNIEAIKMIEGLSAKNT